MRASPESLLAALRNHRLYESAPSGSSQRFAVIDSMRACGREEELRQTQAELEAQVRQLQAASVEAAANEAAAAARRRPRGGNHPG